MKSEEPSLATVLASRKGVLVNKWLEQVFQSYPKMTTKFLHRGMDPFRNPVGHALKEGLPILFDGLIQLKDQESMRLALDNIVRMRAVQDFTAGQSLAFIFALKQMIRTECALEIARFPDEIVALERRIDALALLAFDLFVTCREQTYEIKANEAKRSAFLWERLYRKGAAEESIE